MKENLQDQLLFHFDLQRFILVNIHANSVECKATNQYITHSILDIKEKIDMGTSPNNEYWCQTQIFFDNEDFYPSIDGDFPIEKEWIPPILRKLPKIPMDLKDDVFILYLELNADEFRAFKTVSRKPCIYNLIFKDLPLKLQNEFLNITLLGMFYHIN
ncbi:MAG: hypothetical protein WD512_05725 [Candidatus Paceibacterota bacterium]